MLPLQLEYKGSIYDLNCEFLELDKPQVLLTYEHRPVKEDSYLLAVYGETLEKASRSMNRHLKLVRII